MRATGFWPSAFLFTGNDAATGSFAFEAAGPSSADALFTPIAVNAKTRAAAPAFPAVHAVRLGETAVDWVFRFFLSQCIQNSFLEWRSEIAAR